MIGNPISHGIAIRVRFSRIRQLYKSLAVHPHIARALCAKSRVDEAAALQDVPKNSDNVRSRELPSSP
jgi:hypothetical protein